MSFPFWGALIFQFCIIPKKNTKKKNPGRLARFRAHFQAQRVEINRLGANSDNCFWGPDYCIIIFRSRFELSLKTHCGRCLASQSASQGAKQNVFLALRQMERDTSAAQNRLRHEAPRRILHARLRIFPRTCGVFFNQIVQEFVNLP